MRPRTLQHWLAVLPSLTLVGFLFFIPLLALGFHALRAGLTVDLRYVAWITGLTLFQATASSILAAAIGISLALFYSESRSPLRKVIWNLGLVCFSLPTVLVALSLLGFWRRIGIEFIGWPAILVGHAFLNFPLFLRLVGNRLLELDRNIEKTALSLGANRWQCFWWVTVPRVLPAARSAFVLSFLYCTTSFVMIMLLGGGPRYTTLEVAIYQSIRGEFEFSKAAFFAVIQCVISGSLFYWLGSRKVIEASANRSLSYPLYYPRGRAIRRCQIAGYFSVLFFLALGPLLFLIGKGIADAWHGNLKLVCFSLLRSLSLALVVAMLCVVLVLPMARARALSLIHGRKMKILDWVAISPSVASTLVLSLSWWLFYPSLLRARVGGLVAVVMVQSLFALPLVYRALFEGYQSRAPQLIFTARNLGASRLQTFLWIELPVVQRALALGALFGFVFSLGEVTSLILFSPLQFETLTWTIYRSMSRYDFATANVSALALLILIVASLYVMDWIQKKNEFSG